MEMQRTQSSPQNVGDKNIVEGLILPNFKVCSKQQKAKWCGIGVRIDVRSMEQTRESRNKYHTYIVNRFLSKWPK